ncbi:deoxyguanosinetriphosphate triphosphohydrolase [Nakamurella flava]|uniref:Deoxyguanosinetriphosphate triphosphohydrolase n=1 Tax=Nakamurella flava TaxID=2576308 RepID=A0A4U6QLX4_9ACTN|nr:deoxyguanosinetriphosphate triphosphohydrolase [Nakamurella flava]TKV61132.1 deoxyguanosinetriphosphate triphosphohydrolase [Nakamurella flava]
MTGYRYTDDDTARVLAESVKTAAFVAVGSPDHRAPAPGRSHRTPFARDRARVLHSGAFRRLAGKTQVVGPDGTPDDLAVPRTRLTHSLEVAQIAREIGHELGCDADLVDLAGLAHDIGHPPFGHNGEAALNAAGAAAGGFEANAQNLRLLTRLEAKVVGPDGTPGGLNLTRASLDAVVKYPWPRPDGGGKFGVYVDELTVFGWLRDPGRGRRLCLEAQVMDWADDVAYSVHDVEDGIEAGRVDLARLADPEERLAVATQAAPYSSESVADLAVVLADLLALPGVADCLPAIGEPGSAGRVATKRFTSELTGRLATGVIASTQAVAGPGPLGRYDADLVVPRRLRAEVAMLKAIAVRYVMGDPHRLRGQVREQELLAELVGAITERGAAALDAAFVPAFQAAADDAQRLRVALDQVSLLTDAQAVARHHRLIGVGTR